MYSFLLRACLGSLLKSKIGGHRSKYTCTYHSFSLAFRFSLRDSRQALQFCGTILAILGFCLLIGCGNNSASEIQSPTSSDDDDSSPPVEESVSLLKDIFIGTADSEIYFQTKMGNAIYFFMDSKEYGFELWKTDGTSDGTHLIKDIHPGSESSVDLNWHYSYDLFFAELNNELFFPANDGTNGYALWKTDGTTEGTKLVADINPEISTEINIYFQSAILHDLIRMNNTLFFAGDDGINGILIWKSDGTSSGTVLLQDPSKDLLGYNPETFVVAGNSFYFTAYDEEHGEEPCGSEEGTSRGPGATQEGQGRGGGQTEGGEKAASGCRGRRQVTATPARSRWSRRRPPPLSPPVRGARILSWSAANPARGRGVRLTATERCSSG